MPDKTLARFLFATLTALFLQACKAVPEPFLDKDHRENFAITAEELADMQFYVSTDVLLNPEDPESPGAIFVEERTPGTVVDSGPQWLRVSFDREGTGVVFARDPEVGYDQVYYLATEVEGEAGYQVLFRSPEPVLVHEGKRYSLARGKNAKLLVRTRDLDYIKERRMTVRGRTATPDMDP